MFGASRDSLARAQESLDSRAAEPGFEAVPGDLLAVADLLDREKGLRLQLADSGQTPESRRALVAALLGGRIGPVSLAQVQDVAALRWSDSRDLVDAIEQLAAASAFVLADRDGSLDRVEEELFRFGRAVDASSDLQMTLTDPSLPASAKSGIVASLLAGKAAPTTELLLEHAVGHLHGLRVDDAVSRLSDLAAAQRERVVAHVTVAVPLAPEQRDRLADVLGRLKGRTVQLDVVVDPSVVGGIAVRVGDEIIDGTVAARLEQARRALID
jgi:F-type H+-transporting ATPase subunit delta